MMLESHHCYEFELGDNIFGCDGVLFYRGGDRAVICYSCQLRRAGFAVWSDLNGSNWECDVYVQFYNRLKKP